jgi:long-chain acyl-CoA synthetase
MQRPNPKSMLRLLRRAGVPTYRILWLAARSAASRESSGIHALYALHAQSSSDRPAVVSATGRHSFLSIAEQIRSLAGALGVRGVGPGDRVCVVLPNSPAYLIVLGALRTLGAVPVPVSPKLRARELHHVLQDSEAKGIFSEAGQRAVVSEAVGYGTPRLRAGLRVEVGTPGPGGPGKATTLEALLKGPRFALPRLRLERGKPDTPAILYTSGTTGVPKGARPEIPDTLLLIEQCIERFGMGSGERILLSAPFYHAAPGLLINIAMLLGATLVAPSRFCALDTLSWIERERITYAYLIPPMLQAILDLPEEDRRRYDLGSLRGVITTGALLRPSVRIAACDLFGDILMEFYGSSEVGMVTFLGPDEQRRKPASVGRAVAGVEIRILGPGGENLPAGQVGEVAARSRWLRTSYLGRPEDTEQAYVEGFFRPGDTGFLDDEGYLHLGGRCQDMIVSGGVNIYPAEVERALSEHPDLMDVAVVGVQDARWGEAVWAAVVPARGRTLTEEALRSWLRERIAPFKVPKRFVVEQELPRNPTGKVLKRSLRERYEAQRSPGESSPAAATPTAQDSAANGEATKATAHVLRSRRENRRSNA